MPQVFQKRREMDAGEREHKKEHRPRQAGAKARKKEEHQKKKKGQSLDKHNARAFNVANVGRAKRGLQRNLDRAQKKEYVPQVDRTEELPPPALVVVMGPKGCGKSTLIRSLVKYYTGQNLSDVLGPITVVAGKKRRLTFFECPTDPCSMLDLAKTADLVLLMVDGSFGFELETFEYLNMLQTHGFPKVMGLLTHLDKMKSNKSLNKTKKRLKARFWTEIYQGAKMFYMSGVVNNKYLKNDIRNLTLYISRMKFRPLVWRNTHPYIMVDRFEDLTPAEAIRQDPKVARNVVLYGYVRGSHLKPSMKMHLIGAGDFDMELVDTLPDPCPLPDSERRGSLKTKETLLYAPMANVGTVRFDSDALYIDLRQINYTKPDLIDPAARAQSRELLGGDDYDDERPADAPSELVRKLQDVSVGMDEKLKGGGVRMFADGQLVRDDEESSDSDQDAMDGSSDDDDATEDDDDEEEEVLKQRGGGPRLASRMEVDKEDDETSGSEEEESDEDGDEDDEEEEEEYGDQGSFGENYDDDEEEDSSREDGSNSEDETGVAWKGNLADMAARAFLDRRSGHVDLMELIYGSVKAPHKEGEEEDDKDDDDDDEDFFRVKKVVEEDESGLAVNAVDSSRWRLAASELQDWEAEGEDSAIENLRKRFVTGGWGEEDADEDKVGDDDDSEVYGDFEDLETGEKFESGLPKSKQDQDDELDEEARRLAEKVALKQKFDEEFDEKGGSKAGKKKAGDEEDPEEALALEMARKLRESQLARNKEEFGQDGEFVRLRHEGYRQGLYVRVALRSVPSEFSQNFRPYLPVVLGGLQPHETTMGMLRCRVKRHRWHAKILKSNDPLVFSIGWRRFQSIPIYSAEDANDRQRYLKYTPEHMHCFATFYGPLCPPNTGLLALQTLSKNATGFRVSLTGVVLELNASFGVVKKLKLVGYPFKIFKNTAFIRGMFNTELEVAKFEGAKIRTVSGIRGQIKKAVGQGAEKGAFRATFEDKILMSDIVFCRTWVPMVPARYYNPVFDLLSASGWQGMKTTAQLRKEYQVPIPLNKDSLYKPVERGPRFFNPMVVPKALQSTLPYATKPKMLTARKNKDKSYLSKRAVVMDPEERKKHTLLTALATIRNQKEKKKEERVKLKKAEKQRQLAKEAEKFAPQARLEKKRKYREMGKTQALRAKKQRRGGGSDADD